VRGGRHVHTPGNTITDIDLTKSDATTIIRVGDYPVALAAVPGDRGLYVLVHPGGDRNDNGEIVEVNPTTGVAPRGPSKACVEDQPASRFPRREDSLRVKRERRGSDARPGAGDQGQQPQRGIAAPAQTGTLQTWWTHDRCTVNQALPRFELPRGTADIARRILLRPPLSVTCAPVLSWLPQCPQTRMRSPWTAPMSGLPTEKVIR
jgi:hypothetical protein